MQASRRRFLKTSAAATAASFAATPLLAAPGKKYRTAIIGAGWWGMNILRDAMAHGQCKVVGICDVSEQTREVSAEEITDLNGDQPRKYNDFREMLGKEKPEIVIIATPDHWHALPAIAAIEAGAHVFLEKPTAHTVEESRAILNAARAAKRVVQVGLHRRIGPHHVEAMKFLKSGKVGKVGQVRLFVTGGGGKGNPRRTVQRRWEWIGISGVARRPSGRSIVGCIRAVGAIFLITPTAPSATGACIGSTKLRGGVMRNSPSAFFPAAADRCAVLR